MRNLYLIAIVLSLYHSSSVAEVVYDEAVDGDLPGWEQFWSPFPVFTVIDFGIGSSIVVGTTPWLFNSPDPSDAIQFAIEVNETLQISVGEIVIGNGFNEKVAWVWALVELVIDPLGPSVSTEIAFHVSNSEPGFAVPTTDLPTSFEGLIIGPGEYLLYNNYRFSGPNAAPIFDPDLARLDYTFEFNVDPVPLPTSLILIAPALLLVHAKRRST